MTALAADKPRSPSRAFKTIDLTLSATFIAYKNAELGILLGVGEVVPMASDPRLFAIGKAYEKVDATSAAKTVSVVLDREVDATWLKNDSGTAVVAADVGSLCYYVDDQTVSMSATGRSLAGRVWAVDSTKGVLVEKLNAALAVAEQPDVGSYTSNDYAPAGIIHGAVYDVPTTGAASTITLPAAAQDGTVAYWAADGTKNGHTVQYRDATGPTNLTTALTASKRHLIVVSKRGGKWFANAYVSP